MMIGKFPPEAASVALVSGGSVDVVLSVGGVLSVDASVGGGGSLPSNLKLFLS